MQLTKLYSLIHSIYGASKYNKALSYLFFFLK